MKHTKTLLSLLLISMTIYHTLNSSIVFADVPTLLATSNSILNVALVKDVNEFISTINKASLTLETKVNVKIKKFDLTTFDHAISKLSYLDGYEISYVKRNGYYSLSVVLKYNGLYKLTQAQRNPSAYKRLSASELNLLNVAKAIISHIITKDMTDYEKEMAIHDYIVNNTSYDYTNSEANSISKSSYTVSGVLINKVAVCQGYSEAMKLLLNMVGIECKIVTGTTSDGPHAWNIVKLDNNWYMVDATWNDPILFNNNSRVETLRYDYFNVTNEQLQKDHTWDVSKWPIAASSNYNYFTYAQLTVDNYSDFKSLIIKQIQSGKKEITCYVNNFNAKQYDLNFIFSYYTGPIQYSFPESTEGSVTIILN